MTKNRNDPEIEWKMNYSNELLKRNESFDVILTPSASLGGNEEELADYCILKIMKQKKEVTCISMEYNAKDGRFYAECTLEAGAYTFIAEVNGKEVAKEGKSVN